MCAAKVPARLCRAEARAAEQITHALGWLVARVRERARVAPKSGGSDPFLREELREELRNPPPRAPVPQASPGPGPANPASALRTPALAAQNAGWMQAARARDLEPPPASGDESDSSATVDGRTIAEMDDTGDDF